MGIKGDTRSLDYGSDKLEHRGVRHRKPCRQSGSDSLTDKRLTTAMIPWLSAQSRTDGL